MSAKAGQLQVLSIAPVCSPLGLELTKFGSALTNLRRALRTSFLTRSLTRDTFTHPTPGSPQDLAASESARLEVGGDSSRRAVDCLRLTTTWGAFG